MRICWANAEVVANVITNKLAIRACKFDFFISIQSNSNSLHFPALHTAVEAAPVLLLTD
ncbi:hypothetical protein D3C78_1913720 [compost metagenome]